MIAVSVIMPIYNAEKYLSVALEGLIKQSLSNIEIICVDDGSTDKTLEILKKYQKIDNRVKILRQKNSYAGVARNYGMTVAKGKYLSFLDADDYFLPDMLEKAYLCAESEETDIVVFDGMVFTDNPEQAKEVHYFLREDLLQKDNSFRPINGNEYIFNFTNAAPWNKLFKREFVEREKLFFQPLQRANDVFFVEMALVLANKIGIVREKLVFYRIENTKSLQGTNNDSPLQFAEAFSAVQKELRDRGIYQKYAYSFRNLCLSNCIYNLESLNQGKAFEKLYNALRNDLFHRFEIEQLTREDNYNTYAFDKYLYIKNYSSTEYWMEKYLWLKTRQVPQYLFPFNKIKKGSKIFLYAAGNVGKAFLLQIRKTNFCELKAWVDRKEIEYCGIKTIAPNRINWNDYDYVVIAVERKGIYEDIKKTLLEEYSVEQEKVIWENPII